MTTRHSHSLLAIASAASPALRNGFSSHSRRFGTGPQDTGGQSPCRIPDAARPGHYRQPGLILARFSFVDPVVTVPGHRMGGTGYPCGRPLGPVKRAHMPRHGLSAGTPMNRPIRPASRANSSRLYCRRCPWCTQIPRLSSASQSSDVVPQPISSTVPRETRRTTFYWFEAKGQKCMTLLVVQARSSRSTAMIPSGTRPQ